MKKPDSIQEEYRIEVFNIILYRSSNYDFNYVKKYYDIFDPGESSPWEKLRDGRLINIVDHSIIPEGNKDINIKRIHCPVYTRIDDVILELIVSYIQNKQNKYYTTVSVSNMYKFIFLPISNFILFTINNQPIDYTRAKNESIEELIGDWMITDTWIQKQEL